MVDADLQSAAEEIGGEFAELDPMSVAVTGGGIGLGLFGAEFFAEIAGNAVAPDGGRNKTIVEILSKFGLSGAFILGRRFVGGQMLGVLMVLGAAGASASAMLQVVENFISLIQTGEVTSGSPHTSEAVSRSAREQASDVSASGGEINGQKYAAT